MNHRSRSYVFLLLKKRFFEYVHTGTYGLCRSRNVGGGGGGREPSAGGLAGPNRAGYWRRRPARGMDRRQSSTFGCPCGRGVRVCTVCVCTSCARARTGRRETRRAPAGRRRRRRRRSSFRMVQHEYVLDETVCRRLVRRYHLKGAAAATMLGAADTHREYDDDDEWWSDGTGKNVSFLDAGRRSCRGPHTRWPVKKNYNGRK